MGDFRITIEGVGDHGCGREAKDGDVVRRCGRPSCVDCKAVALAQDLKASGALYNGSAKLEHWPVPGAAGTSRNGQKGQEAGPIDDLLTGIRKGAFVLLALALVVCLAACSLLSSTTNPTIVDNTFAIVINMGPGQTPPQAGGAGSGSLCGIPIMQVVVNGPSTFAHGSGPQLYTATPLDQGGTDITTECSTPATATFTVGGVFSGTSASKSANSITVNPTAAGTGNLGASIGGVQSAPVVVQVQ